MSENILPFMQRWTDFLNNDEEIHRRLAGFRTFAGGPNPYPGPGPYPPPSIAYDPTGWSKAKGYPTTVLNGKELVEITIPRFYTFKIELKDGVFSITEGKAKKPCLGVEMPLSLFKEMILSEHRILWALADERNRVTYLPGLGLSDWVTIFEVLVTGQELVDMNLQLRETIKNL